ncbi:uncharacterized protein LOC123409045 [Hordeum vulgare subsp. vulgare]|uniref:uncharacterized protein LOC123409045 n=1 Tax=Hordeum vulgare subsp. vulgare TaxID=112509 RepID=UPI001D1A32CE|nr:uncharacterized protein LOC123409045 [Hordeum vulgare subsp. vulgare]
MAFIEVSAFLSPLSVDCWLASFLIPSLTSTQHLDNCVLRPIVALNLRCLTELYLYQRLSYMEVLDCLRLKVIENKASNISSFQFAGNEVQLSLGKSLQVKSLKLHHSCVISHAIDKLPSIVPNLERLNIISPHEGAVRWARDKAKGARKLRAADVALNHRLVSWRVGGGAGDGPAATGGYNYRGASASAVLAHPADGNSWHAEDEEEDDADLEAAAPRGISDIGNVAADDHEQRCHYAIWAISCAARGAGLHLLPQDWIVQFRHELHVQSPSGQEYGEQTTSPSCCFYTALFHMFTIVTVTFSTFSNIFYPHVVHKQDCKMNTQLVHLMLICSYCTMESNVATLTEFKAIFNAQNAQYHDSYDHL